MFANGREKATSSKTLIAVTVICVISIASSALNIYLILNDFRTRQEQLSELQNAIDEAEKRIGAVESNLSNLADKIHALNESMLAVAPQQTPANVYESAHKSVVVIRTASGQGSGFFYSSPNVILTNWHVVGRETDIEVQFYDRTRSEATLIGTDAYSDVAAIMVSSPPAEAKPLQFGNSSRLYIGQQVIAIGNPLGLTGSLSSGYISQINRRLDLPPVIVPVLQLDVTIAPGSSGGPLFDLSGKVVGITNAGTAYGFNFAVPSNIVKRVASSLIEKGDYQHPFVGFSAIELNPETTRSLNILNVEPFQTGLMIMDVVPDTPAAEAGLKAAVSTQEPDGTSAYTAKDIILAVDDHPTLTVEDWAAYIEDNVSPDQPITLTLWRSGETVSIVITTTYRPPYPE